MDPELADDILKEEIESRNNLKLTDFSRFTHKETGTKLWKVKIGLEDEGTMKRVLKDGVFLGYTKHKCDPYFDRNRAGNTDQSINQCYNCQKWDPKHTRTNCPGVRACLWCAVDHFHKDCPLFQARRAGS